MLQINHISHQAPVWGGLQQQGRKLWAVQSARCVSAHHTCTMPPVLGKYMQPTIHPHYRGITMSRATKKRAAGLFLERILNASQMTRPSSF